MPREEPRNRKALSDMRSIATLLSGTIVAQVIGIAAMPILSRIYGPKAFGILAIFLSTSAVVSTISALRYELAIVLPPQDDDAIILRQLAIAIVTALSAITLIVTLLIYAWTPLGERNWWILLIGISVFVTGATNVLYFWLTRYRNYRRQSTSRVIQAAVAAGCQLALGLLITPTAEWLIVGYVVGQFFGLGPLILGRRSSVPQVRPSMRKWWELAIRYRKMPFFNAPNALVDSLRLNGVNVLIGSRSLHALGQFSMAWKLTTGPASLLASAISQVYFPNMAEALPGTLHTLVRRITIRALGLSALPFLMLALVAPAVVPWFLGAGWEQSGYMVQALCPYLFLTVATASLSTVFVVVERQGTLLAFAVAYSAVPLTVLALTPGPIVGAIWLLSGAMSLMLVFLIFLTLHVTKQFDAKRLDGLSAS